MLAEKSHEDMIKKIDELEMAFASMSLALEKYRDSVEEECDIVHVIRCQNCVYFKGYEYNPWEGCETGVCRKLDYHIDKPFTIPANGHDYCSDAKRRE